MFPNYEPRATEASRVKRSLVKLYTRKSMQHVCKMENIHLILKREKRFLLKSQLLPTYYKDMPLHKHPQSK